VHAPLNRTAGHSTESLSVCKPCQVFDKSSYRILNSHEELLFCRVAFAIIFDEEEEDTKGEAPRSELSFY
jgi:hypothetical protein